jgi:hypothetical protein
MYFPHLQYLVNPEDPLLIPLQAERSHTEIFLAAIFNLPHGLRPEERLFPVFFAGLNLLY